MLPGRTEQIRADVLTVVQVRDIQQEPVAGLAGRVAAVEQEPAAMWVKWEGSRYREPFWPPS